MKTTENGKKRINIIDVLFLIVIVAVVIVAAAGLTGVTKKDAEIQNKVELTLEIKNADPEFLDNIEEGQIVYDAITKEEVGNIASVSHKPSRELVENYNSKKLEYADIPDKIDLNVEIEAVATMKQADIMVSENAVKIGKSMSYYTGEAVLSGTIIGIEYDETLFEKGSEVK